MIKATTPTLTLTLPDSINLNSASKVVFTIAQDFVSIDKEIAAADISTNVVTVRLSQQDTVNLSSRVPAKIQLNWIYSGGTRAATKLKTIDVLENLKGDVIE